MLEAIDQIHRDLGFPEYTGAFGLGNKSMIDVFAITFALMVGTAGLPHVIIRFYTVKSVRAARWSAFWALLFIGLLYTCAPAIATFARVNLIQTLQNQSYTERPQWFKSWEPTGLIAWTDKNGDGLIQYGPGAAFVGKPEYTLDESGESVLGSFGEVMLKNVATDNGNELYVDRDIMVLANPEIANLPAWVVALVAAGGLAAALSTAAGLLLVISSSISHDLGKRILNPNMSEKTELKYARIAAGGAVVIAGYFGINPPGFVAQVVAFAFGLAASSFFPVIILGIFSKRTTREGAISGMLAGILFTAGYIIYFKAFAPGATADDWWFGISPEGIGSVGMVINFAFAIVVSQFTPPPPLEVQAQVERLREPGDA
jgi:cation/acetate symporter